MKSNIANTELEKFLSSINFKVYKQKNPNSAKEISKFLTTFINKYRKIPGINSVFKKLSDNTLGKSPPLKWFNIFSQIRCTNFLLEKGFIMNRFEAKKNQKVLDIKFSNNKFCEIKSFLPRERDPDYNYSIEEEVIKKFTKEVVEHAFIKQKTDLLIIDNIFSENSKQYRLLNYFLDFIKDKNSSRYFLIQKYLDTYLSKMLFLSFINSITINPTIKFVGNDFL
jgi:hypothetical protein